ncbi:outer membrane lipoprotein chaperone LolA [Panacagrimonas sp.]|uniref:outer membrane lipoprotein chaperone LolA n=1 Tax=Panacagrimonas sp. TaxID=2480088 RepID=UPI003B51D587
MTLLLLQGTAHAASAEDELRQFVENVNTLSGRFVQTQTDEHGEIVSSGAGTVAISKPGRFRWAYEKPYVQLMVCDGERIWAYDPDLAQVTVRPAGEALAGTPAELLSQKARLSDTFRIEDRGMERDLRRVHLQPRAEDSEFQSIELWLRDGVPQRLRFTDPLGGASDVELRDLEVNPKLDAARFVFEVPAGTEVVEAVPAP